MSSHASSDSEEEDEETEESVQSDSDTTASSEELQRFARNGPQIHPWEHAPNPVLGEAGPVKFYTPRVPGESMRKTRELFPARRAIQELVSTVHDSMCQEGRRPGSEMGPYPQVPSHGGLGYTGYGPLRHIGSAIQHSPWKVMADILKMNRLDLGRLEKAIEDEYTVPTPSGQTVKRMPPDVRRAVQQANEVLDATARQPPRRLNNEGPDPNYFSRMVMKRPRE